MATRKTAPTVRLRRLAAELRRLRGESGLTRDDVSEETGINITTLYRIESAHTRPQGRTLQALLTLYGVDDEQRGQLVDLCKESVRQGWLQPYHSELSEEYTAYISFEADAVGIRNYESLFVPGQLQTEGYARALIRGVLLDVTDDQVEDRVCARMERQQLDTLKLWAIVDEAVLRRVVGGSDTMRAQLRHLHEMADMPSITLQVVPFSAGAHLGMHGPFVLLDFEDPMDTDLLYIEGRVGGALLEGDGEVRRYTTIFDHLRAVALSPGDSMSLVTEIANNIM